MKPEIIKLREENDALKSEIHYLKNIAMPSGDMFKPLGLGRAQRRLLERLYNASPMTVANTSMMEAIRLGDVEDVFGQLRVALYRLRKGLAPYGVALTMHYGEGYSIDADNKAILARVIGADN